MPQRFAVVTSPGAVVANIRTFHDLVSEMDTENLFGRSGSTDDVARELIANLSKYRSWYAVRDRDSRTWRFGPSIWVGYSDMSPDLYRLRSQDQDLDGRITEGILGQWFEPAREGHELHAEVVAQFVRFLGSHGKAPNRAFRISILPEQRRIEERTETTPGDRDLADLIIKVASRLSPLERRRVLQALSGS